MSSAYPFFTDATAQAVPIHALAEAEWELWLSARSDAQRQWLKATDFTPTRQRSALLPGDDGGIDCVILGLGKDGFLADPHLWGGLATSLPKGDYAIADALEPEAAFMAALGWALGRYRFTRYKEAKNGEPRLVLPDGVTKEVADAAVAAHFLVRDLVNTPTNDMGPVELAATARKVAEAHGATYREIVGDDLLAQNFPAIHTVGRASVSPPRLIDFTWGDETHPKVTLVGKGVCFDTGGLNIKTGTYMRLMKKDMGGGAHALGLAQWIMESKLPIRLRCLVPAVENSVSGNAYRPGDIMATRKGLTVEIDNTDAEGRNVLCDALAAADEEAPDLIIDFATLTGAARVALGPDLPALFTPDQSLADDFAKAGQAQSDPVWRLPLWSPYLEMLDSKIADICHASSGGFAGAITAALFLQRFVEKAKAWAHLDLYAWNQRNRPGRPEGGEAMSLRAAYALIRDRYARR
jgi:leucyl aminopeptidase